MSLQQQLDPITRNMLATMGRAFIALANGEVDIPVLHPTALDLARRALQEGDGRSRRVLSPRRNYSVKDMPAKKLDALTPAARRVYKALKDTAAQTAPEIAEMTGLKRKTVENILSTLNAMKVLVRKDVLASDDHS